MLCEIGVGGPTYDGQVAIYRCGEAVQYSWFNEEKRVIFVNGMKNEPCDHADSAKGLSLLQGCPVIGVFNRTGGFLRDIGQCVGDKVTLVGPQAGNYAGWSAAIELGYQAAKLIAPGLTKIQFVRSMIDGNPATVALYDLLVGASGTKARRYPIYCHSQGNLIVSNALTAVALAMGLKTIAGMKVFSFGSPCRYWPAGIIHVQRAFTFDPISWLDLRMGFQFDKVGFVAAHGFDTYRKHEGEFTVNRFRWGGWGMTAHMDEEGLADYCVGLGKNQRLLELIFERLRDGHWSDSDDVAHIYCKKMRTKHELIYASVLKIDTDKNGVPRNDMPKLGKLLIELLESGITTGGERTEINYIRGLI